MTNADRIRKMSNKELAELLNDAKEGLEDYLVGKICSHCQEVKGGIYCPYLNDNFKDGDPCQSKFFIHGRDAVIENWLDMEIT